MLHLTQKHRHKIGGRVGGGGVAMIKARNNFQLIVSAL